MPSLMASAGSSISLGFGKVNKGMYITEAKGRELAGSSAEGGYSDVSVLTSAKKARERIKGELTSTHYAIGDRETIKPDYATSGVMTDFSHTPINRIKLDKEHLRAVHFHLGVHKAPYETTAKASFVKPVDARRATLSEDVKADLRAHHFAVSTGQAPEYETESARSFKFDAAGLRVSPEEAEKKLRHKEELRATHLHMGGTGPRSFAKSSSQPDPRDSPGFVTKASMPDVDLGKTNWSMGTAAVDYATTYTAANNRKAARPDGHEKLQGRDAEQAAAVKSMIKRSSVYIGTDRNKGVASEYGSMFKGKDLTSADNRARISAMRERISDNRNTHYHLGTDALDYEKTMVAIDPRSVGFKAPRLSAETKAQLKNTHFHVGFSEAEFKSIASSDYIAKPISKSALDASLKADLRASHFTVATDDEVRMETVYAGTTKPRAEHSESAAERAIDKEKRNLIKRELKGTHFVLGRSETDYILSNRMPKHDLRSVERIGHFPDLNRTNWSMGDAKTDYTGKG